MIKAQTAYTREIDDAELAVSELLAQLNLTNLQKNSIGILTCYAEYIDSGVVAALCDKLPFDVVGCTSMGCGTNGACGHLDLTLMVLTSDDVEFSAVVSSSLASEQIAPVQALVDSSLAELTTPPVFMLAFMPLLYNVGGEVFLSALDNALNLPVFGTLAVDHTTDYSASRTIFNGNAYADCMVSVVFAGAVQPRFMIASLAIDKAMKQQAIITDSDNNLLKQVNGQPVIEYMTSLGLTRDGQIEGPSTIPFIVDLNDGTKPMVRAIFAQTPEGYAVCGASMPVNATLSIGSIDYTEVMDTTRMVLDEAVAAAPFDALLSFSCIGRNYALGVKTEDELSLFEKSLTDTPFQITYSGGEVCPLADSEGNLRNRFHNDTIIVCAL